jgi:DNA-binding beta-propeller fold protein YncE
VSSSNVSGSGLALVALACTLAACAPKGEIFAPPAAPLRWPAPPQTARIEYVGQLVTDRDLKPGVSLGAAIFGESPRQSMLSPYAVCTDGANRVFVSDSNAQIVHVFDLASRRYERWPDPKAGPALAQPLGIAWDPRGRLLVADAAAGHVVEISAEGQVLRVLGAGLLERPSGIALDAARGRLYVADAAAHQVVILGADGALVRRLGERGTGRGRFNFPTNVALDGAGRLYVTDSMNFRVQVFDENLAPQSPVGGQGDVPGSFILPKGIALDGEDHLYVVDAGFEAVQIFDAQGWLLLSFGREGHGPGEFWLPAGIHIDASDRIWVADSYNRRVQVFQYLRGGE